MSFENDESEDDLTLPGISEGEIIVIRSARRKRNISAYRQGVRIIVSIPARMSKADEHAIVPEMIAKIRSQESSRIPSEEGLMERTGELMASLAPEITARPASINWRPMRERWGSCTTVDKTIRISERLNNAPDYALRYVLFHELIHLRIAGHGDDFQELLERYPEKERAEAFLEGYEAGSVGSPEEILELPTIQA